jgi:hypothetical protein
MWGAALEGWLARDTPLRRCGPWVGLVIAAAAYYQRFAKDPVGMEVYSRGGECVLHGEPLRICAEQFSYPPALAFLMAPFAAMPMGPRIVVWYLVSLAASVGCFWVSGRWSQIELAWLRIVTVIVSLKFVLAVFEYQAYDTLAAFIVDSFCAMSSTTSRRSMKKPLNGSLSSRPCTTLAKRVAVTLIHLRTLENEPVLPPSV